MIAGRSAQLHVVDQRGRRLARVDASSWLALRPGDTALLSRCGDGTLDVGCGPGRLALALAQAGFDVLGVDLAIDAVRHARRSGAPVLLRDVFRPLPREGHWRTLLLADGNVGIGGDPVVLLRRCRQLLAAGGAVLAEVSSPGTPSWRGQVRLRYGGQASSSFAWATVSRDDIASLAEAAGMVVREHWDGEGRWFVRLTG
jgi:SAM-dependent methyltransferase